MGTCDGKPDPRASHIDELAASLLCKMMPATPPEIDGVTYLLGLVQSPLPENDLQTHASCDEEEELR